MKAVVGGGFDTELLALGLSEIGLLGIDAEPDLTRVHRRPHGMQEYVLGHMDRLELVRAGSVQVTSCYKVSWGQL